MKPQHGHRVSLRFFIGLSLAALVFSAVNLYGDDNIGAPSFDNLSEATHKKLTWDDFQGKPIKPPNLSRWDSNGFAHISTGLRLGSYDTHESEVEGRWQARPIKIRPYSVMDKNLSAVAPGSRSDYSLAHEQLHFDIAETFSRKLALELVELVGEDDSPRLARLDLIDKLRRRFNAAQQELNELQNQYDRETGNGQKKRLQKKWAKQVNQEFAEVGTRLRQALAEASDAG